MFKSRILKKLILFIFFAVLTLFVSAQQITVGGNLYSSQTKEKIGGASIRFVTKDSSRKYLVLTDSLGHFSFAGVEKGSYILSASAMSFELKQQPVKIGAATIKLALDSIFLIPSFDALASVTVVAKRSTVLIKNDTLVFSASAFRVRKNGTAEDLFKKIPGMEVDKTSGALKAQGESVTHIYVDGKPFFGNDIKSVTQNFPAEVIDKVEVIDKKSDQAIATKVEDGISEKIINITLKKNRKKGLFGKDYLSGGTAGRYEGKININSFNNDRKISIVSGANNTGRSDNSNSGSDDASYNNWNGLNENRQIKVNYADKYGKNFDFSSWLGYEWNKTEKEQSIDRQYIYTDSSTYYSEKNSSAYKSRNAYAGLYFEYRPDTLTIVRLNQNLGYSNNKNNGHVISQTLLKNGNLLNSGSRNNSGSSISPNLNGQVSMNHKFAGSRRNIFLSVNNNTGYSQNESFNQSGNYIYTLNQLTDSLPVHQYQDNKNNNSNLGASINYSEPMGTSSSLNFGYNYNYSDNVAIRNVYDYNSQNYSFDRYLDSLSSNYHNNNMNSAALLSYNYGSKTSGFGIGMRWMNAEVKSARQGKDSIFQQSFTGFAPNLSFFINHKRSRFNLFYNFNLQAPQPVQLQSVIDNSNPMYIRLGNPDLKYAMVHQIRYRYNYYNPKKETGFNSNAGFSSIFNNISSSTVSDMRTGSQITKPVNLDGAYNWDGWVSFFSRMYLGKNKLKWSVNLNANGRKSSSITNNELNTNLGNYEKIYLGLSYDAPKWIDFHTDLSISRQESNYSLQPNMNSISYQMELSPNITLSPTDKTEINIDYDYRQTSGLAAGYNTSVNLLNTDVVQYLGNKKNVWIKLKAYDLLNQNVNLWRYTGDNYIQDTRANVLSRYVLLSINFKLNKFNTSKEDMDMQDMPKG